MADVIGDILPLAVGIAISPVPLIAVILMLFSRHARTNGPAFLVGWVLGVAVVTVVVLLLADAGEVGTDSGASDAVSWVKVALGVLLVVLAVRTWRKRPAPGETGATPKWMGAIDAFTPVKAFGIAVLLSSVNPKNFVLAVGAGGTIAQGNLSSGEDAVAVIVFVVLASSTIAIAVGAYLLGGTRARHMLDGWKSWLSTNNATVMAVLLLVMGVVIVGKGLAVFD